MVSKRWLFTVFSLFLLGFLTACEGGVAPAPAPESAAPSEQLDDAAADETGDTDSEELVVLDTIISTEPPSLDPALGTDTTSIFFMRQMFHGLTGFDENANVVPDLATDWSVSEDGLTWTFNMRDDVNWVRRNADGEFEELAAVNAHDVVYGITRTLDPNTASDYAYVLYIIDGAEALNTADPEAADFEEIKAALGVKAVDDTTVEITLKSPAAYFPSIVGMWVTFPQPQAVIEEHGDQWTEPGNIVTNGPYTLKEWQHQASLYITKNPLWRDADTVQVDEFGGPIITEASTAMAMYENNEIDYMADPGVGVPLPDLDRVKADPEMSEELFIAPRLCTYYYGFMNTKPPFDNDQVRKAFAMTIDRQSLIDNVLKGEQIPAHSFAPPGVFANFADDMSIGGFLVQDDFAAQVAEAQEILADAGYPEGEGLDITLMHNVSEAHGQIAEVVSNMWKRSFPKMEMTVETQEWAVYLKTLQPDSPDDAKPDVYRMGWCADYPDSNNWLNDVFNSASSSNYAKFNNAEFDALVEEAAFEADPDTRVELYHQAEDIFTNQVTPIAPIYYYTYVRMYKPWVEYVISPVTGDPISQFKIDMAAKKAARGE